VRLGFLGPEGTFCSEALRATAPGGADAIPYATERAAILAVEAGDLDAAIVPIENSLEGGVTGTLDALAHDAPSVQIVGEVVLPVVHALIAERELELAEVTAVASHPQALGQCARFLESELPDAARIAATSTAEAVRNARGTVAAIGTVTAARIYDRVVVREQIEDEPGNATRFVWLAPAGADPGIASGTAHRTTILFAGAGDASPGWLVRCLSEFAFRGINLTKIESRPRKQELGHYLFVLDCDGRAEDDLLAGAIDGLRAHCEEVRVLGSYPAAT
jgi:prephenate dehydratase